MSRLRIGVVFGGESVEHEVSVITAQQVIALLGERHTVVPLYISKAGAWYTGEALLRLESFRDVDVLLGKAAKVSPVFDGRPPGTLAVSVGRRGFWARGAAAEIVVDVILPLVHGSHGEDGTLAGLCELWGVAYAGCGVSAGGLSMDKPLAKQVFRAAGLPVLDDVVVTRRRWREESDAVIGGIEKKIGYPAFVKPASLGSSIGVAPAADRGELKAAVDLALVYDHRAVVELKQEGIVEINCAVLGRGDDVRASLCEQPVTGGVLTYEDKYAGGGKAGDGKGGGAKGGGMKSAQRIIPAPLDEALTQRIQQLAMAAFQAIGAAGVARVDFLVRPDSGEVILNEINTVPGSLAFYLFEPAGLGFAELLAALIEQAQAEHAERRESTYSIDSWLLSAAAGGTKAGAR